MALEYITCEKQNKKGAQLAEMRELTRHDKEMKSDLDILNVLRRLCNKQKKLTDSSIQHCIHLVISSIE